MLALSVTLLSRECVQRRLWLRWRLRSWKYLHRKPFFLLALFILLPLGVCSMIQKPFCYNWNDDSSKFFLIPVLFYNFYVPGNTLPLIYHVWIYCTWSFFVLHIAIPASNSSHGFGLRLIICNYTCLALLVVNALSFCEFLSCFFISTQILVF